MNISTKFHIYGDESIQGDTVVYAHIIVPVDILEFAEKTLAEVKEFLKLRAQHVFTVEKFSIQTQEEKANGRI